MKPRIAKASSLVVSVTLLICATAFAQKDGKPQPKPYTDAELRKMSKGKMEPPHGASFYIGPVDGAPGRFSMLLTDAGQSFVEESYLLNQLDIILAIMVEAQKFAKTEEAKGAKPVITRFADKQEPTFMVDVEKNPVQSRFYVTIKSVSGKKLTVDMGVIKRSDPSPDPNPLYFLMLDRVRAAISEGK